MFSLGTFRDLIERNEKLHGSEPALICDDLTVTYAAYGKRARRLADGLYRLGLRSQDRVSMLAMNCPEYVDFYGTAEIAGFVAAPLNYRLSPSEIGYIVADLSPRILIFQDAY